MRRSLVGIVLILALVAAGCDREPSAANGKADGKAESPAKPAATQTSANTPSDAKSKASLPRVDLDGIRKLIAEAAGRNEVLVIDFWATWCSPCIDLFPTLHNGVEKLGKGVRLMSVTLDNPGEFEDAAIEFLGKHHAVADAYLLDPDTDKRLAVVDGLGKRWNNLVVPAILVYGRDGQLAYEFFERDKDDEMLAKIAQLTAAQIAPKPVENLQTQPTPPTP